MTVLVGYIPTAEGEAALDRAITEARNRFAKLIVVNAGKGDVFVDDRFAQSDEVKKLRKRLDGEDVTYELFQPIGGHDSADEVLEAAEQHDVELIVIGLRKRTPVGKLIMGSTAQRILLQAECPVLAVKAR